MLFFHRATARAPFEYDVFIFKLCKMENELNLFFMISRCLQWVSRFFASLTCPLLFSHVSKPLSEMVNVCIQLFTCHHWHSFVDFVFFLLAFCNLSFRNDVSMGIISIFPWSNIEHVMLCFLLVSFSCITVNDSLSTPNRKYVHLKSVEMEFYTSFSVHSSRKITAIQL